MTRAIAILLGLMLSTVAHGAYFVYAPAIKGNNQDDLQSVFVVDGPYASRVAEVEVRPQPQWQNASIASHTVSADGERVFLAHQNGGISILDATTLFIARQFTIVDLQPSRILVQALADGRERLILNDAGRILLREGDPQTLRYDDARQLTLAEAGADLALSPDGRWLLSSGDTGVALVDPESLTVRARLDLGTTAGALRFHPADPNRAYLLLPEAGAVVALSVSDTALRERDRLALGSDVRPVQLAVRDDGLLLVADQGLLGNENVTSRPGTVFRLRDEGTGGLRLLDTLDTLGRLRELAYDPRYPPQVHPIDLGLSPDGTRLFLLQNVWRTQDAGVYLSVYDESSGWQDVRRPAKVGVSALSRGDLVGPECARCPRGYRPLSPTPKTRPAALSPLLLLLLPLVWRRRGR